MLARDGIASTLFPLLLAGLLAAMTFWLDRAARPPVEGLDGKTRHDPDYMIDNFTVHRFGDTGQLQNILKATHMRHFPDDDSTLVTAPDLTYLRTPPTHITALKAELNSGATHVKLIDNVVVTRGSSSGKPNSVLVTSVLDAYPDDETASTNAPVTITQGQSKVHGIGLQANNKTSLYVLNGPVNGIFYRKGEVDAPPTAIAPIVPIAPVAKPTAVAKKPAAMKPVAKTKPARKPKAKANAKPVKSKPAARPKR